jgi:hypothetical protein
MQARAAICPWIWRSPELTARATNPATGDVYVCRQLKDWRAGPGENEVIHFLTLLPFLFRTVRLVRLDN